MAAITPAKKECRFLGHGTRAIGIQRQRELTAFCIYGTAVLDIELHALYVSASSCVAQVRLLLFTATLAATGKVSIYDAALIAQYFRGANHPDAGANAERGCFR